METKELYTIVHWRNGSKERLTLDIFTAYEYASGYATSHGLQFWHIDHPAYERERQEVVTC